MSLSYTDAKIIEAYKLAKGNETKVNQVISLLAQQDPELLKGLTKKYMPGIIASRVRQALSGKTEESAVQTTRQAANTSQTKPTAEDGFGMEIFRASSDDNAEVFGFDSGAPIRPPRKASQAHIDAIHQMAARAKTRFNK